LGQKLDILAVGNINIDMSFFVEGMPKPDDETFARDFDVFHGGSAANFAVGTARLGQRTGIFGCVGADPLGREALRLLKEEKVSTNFVRISKKSRTGTVCVLVEEGGVRRMIAYRGANEELKLLVKEEIPQAKFVQLCNVSRKVLGEVLKRKGKRKIFLDPGGGSKDLRMEDLRGVDLLFVNEVECWNLTGTDYNRGSKILSEHVGTAVVKLGSGGAFMREDEKSAYQEALPVKVVDTTGAGDAFNAGFVAALCNGKSGKDCLLWGNGVAALKIQSKGARTGLPTLRNLAKFLQEMRS
jgi:ribokinase